MPFRPLSFVSTFLLSAFTTLCLPSSVFCLISFLLFTLSVNKFLFYCPHTERNFLSALCHNFLDQDVCFNLFDLPYTKLWLVCKILIPIMLFFGLHIIEVTLLYTLWQLGLFHLMMTYVHSVTARTISTHDNEGTLCDS